MAGLQELNFNLYLFVKNTSKLLAIILFMVSALFISCNEESLDLLPYSETEASYYKDDEQFFTEKCGFPSLKTKQNITEISGRIRVIRPITNDIE